MADENNPGPVRPFFNLNVSDLLGGGKGVEKLADTVGAGAGRLADGISRVADAKWLSKIDANNEAYRITTVGAATTQVLEERLRALKLLSNEAMQLQNVSITEAGVSAQFAGLSPEMRDIQERARQRVAYENVMQQINQETVVAHAALELNDAGEVSEEPVEPDWLTRFFRTAQDISNAEMQLIFGRILAGEVKEPGAFSLRTIDFLSTITKQEGELFRRLCSFALKRDASYQTVYFETEAKNYNIPNIAFGELQHLQSIGLINYSTGIINGYIIRSEGEIFLYGENYIEVEGRRNTVDKSPIIDVGAVSLTNMGQELARVCQPEIDPCVLEYMVNTWTKKEHQVTIKPRVDKPADI